MISYHTTSGVLKILRIMNNVTVRPVFEGSVSLNNAKISRFENTICDIAFYRRTFA